jgi:hypothetical protein
MDGGVGGIDMVTGAITRYYMPPGMVATLSLSLLHWYLEENVSVYVCACNRSC